ncbi:CHAP domain-containing protein [Dictyobacter formicarum]|uniref:Peptidase C51 domain-containing protein n=1 Tax=Dictyobacter formicarum TaxID=2778368 RepID=A0ABQ3VQA5_9CHLR|nr:CHAP domain-containing protein [Dictyobacter formicarum]GHO88160.1 hypothetical protein KSZ_61660 [Dictyobacter formicarum]
MGAFGKVFGCLGALAVGCLLVVILMVAAVIVPLLGSGTSTDFLAGGGGGSSSVVAQAAQQLVAHIFGPLANDYDPADRFLQPVIGYWKGICHTDTGALCAVAMPNNLQCVYFVAAAQWLGGNPLPRIMNAEDFWPAYAHQAGWQEIPSPSSFPTSPPVAPHVGDLIVWQGGAHLEQGKWVEYGHIAVVLAFQAPMGGTMDRLPWLKPTR